MEHKLEPPWKRNRFGQVSHTRNWSLQMMGAHLDVRDPDIVSESVFLRVLGKDPERGGGGRGGGSTESQI